MPDPQDLVTLPSLQSLLAAGGTTLNAAQLDAAPALITDASQLIARECRRSFALAAYDGVYGVRPGQADKGEPDTVDLPQFPVQALTRVAGGRATALTVTNTDRATNQRATVKFATTGDPEAVVVRTGLVLTRVASGTVTTTPVNWSLASPFTTVAAVASQINAIGGGWKATTTAALGPYPAADLYGPLQPVGAFAGAGFDIFTDDLSDAAADLPSGTLYLPSWGASATDAFTDPYLWPTSGDVAAFGSRPPVRVSYTAGWATIPGPLQRACAELVRATLYRLNVNGALKSETLDEWSYTLRDTWPAMPEWVKGTVARYRMPF